jgi:hypothetical protein
MVDAPLRHASPMGCGVGGARRDRHRRMPTQAPCRSVGSK